MTFEQWANLAEEGLGMMCRTNRSCRNLAHTSIFLHIRMFLHNRDCDWLDPSLYCQNYKTSIRVQEKNILKNKIIKNVFP